MQFSQKIIQGHIDFVLICSGNVLMDMMWWCCLWCSDWWFFFSLEKVEDL